MKNRIAIAICIALLSSACASSSASYHYVQKQMQQGDINFHKTLRVDEYLNAFPQDWLKVPEGKPLVVRMDPLITKEASKDSSLIYQIAVKTRHATPTEATAPMALSFVADVSGSMSGEKISDMQQSLIDAIRELKDNDRLSLVIFNDTATVIASNVLINSESRQTLIEHVRKIQAGGGTNIESGLVTGYRELTAFPSGLSKRLIILTDGQSSVDTLSPEQIAEKAAVQYQAGARISAIGLGFDVDEDMLRRIAEYGGGHYYFAENSRELTRILRDNLQTTIIPVAKEATLVIELAEGYVFKNLYGPGVKETRGKTAVTVHLGELNVNDWRILIAEIGQEGGSSRQTPIYLSGSYVNLVNNQKQSAQELPRESIADAPESLHNVNTNVLRNSVLYGNALALIETSKLNQQGEYAGAIKILDTQISNNKILDTVDHSEMIRKEQENLSTVRSILMKKVSARQKPETATADRSATVPVGSGSVIKNLIVVGLKISEQALPGFWSTISKVLAAALE